MPTGFLWIPIGFLQDSYWLPIGFLQCSHEIPTGIIWESTRGSYLLKKLANRAWIGAAKAPLKMDPKGSFVSKLESTICTLVSLESIVKIGFVIDQHLVILECFVAAFDAIS